MPNHELRHPRCVCVMDLIVFFSVYCYKNIDDEISTSNSSIPWNILVSYSQQLLNQMMASE
jgi:hypothetical protein